MQRCNKTTSLSPQQIIDTKQTLHVNLTRNCQTTRTIFVTLLTKHTQNTKSPMQSFVLPTSSPSQPSTSSLLASVHPTNTLSAFSSTISVHITSLFYSQWEISPLLRIIHSNKNISIFVQCSLPVLKPLVKSFSTSLHCADTASAIRCSSQQTTDRLIQSS